MITKLSKHTQLINVEGNIWFQQSDSGVCNLTEISHSEIKKKNPAIKKIKLKCEKESQRPG